MTLQFFPIETSLEGPPASNVGQDSKLQSEANETRFQLTPVSMNGTADGSSLLGGNGSGAGQSSGRSGDRGSSDRGSGAVQTVEKAGIHSETGFGGKLERLVDDVPAPIAAAAGLAGGFLARMPGGIGAAGKVFSVGMGLTYGSDMAYRFFSNSEQTGFTNPGAAVARDAAVLGSIGIGALAGGAMKTSELRSAEALNLNNIRPFNDAVAEDWKTISSWAEGTKYPEVRQQFLDGIKDFKPEEQTDIRRALSVAEDAHMGQFRKVHLGSAVQDPYIIHPVRTATILTNEAGVKDSDTIVSALLHDSVEDSGGRYTVADLNKGFNTNVGSIVDGVTKPPTIDGVKPDLAPYYASLHASSESTRLVKLADRLDNIRDTSELTNRGFQTRKLQETIDHYVPMAENTSPFFENELKAAVRKLQDSLN